MGEHDPNSRLAFSESVFSATSRLPVPILQKRLIDMNEPALRSVFDEKQRTEEEKLYFGMIDRAIVARHSDLISNGKPGHAVYLIYKMLKAAEREVQVLTGTLARTLNGVLAWGDENICKAAVEFLSRGGRLSILVMDDMDAKDGGHPLVDAVGRAELRDRFDLARPAEDFEQNSWRHHFLLMDRSALRIETNAEKAEAIVNFNDPDMGGRLGNVFDGWLKNADSLSAPAPQ